MTLSRTRLWFALILCLEFARPSHAENVTFTISQPVTRVNVPPSALTEAALKAVTSAEGDLRPAYPICATQQAAIDFLGEVALKERLAFRLNQLSAAEIGTLITRIENEPNPARKFSLVMYGSVDLPTVRAASGPEKWGAPIMEGLRLKLLAGLEHTLPDKMVCFTAAQLDQINAESIRVMRAVVGALTPAPAQATQKPAIPGGIGIQKPQ